MKETVSNKIVFLNYLCTLGVVVQHCRLNLLQNIVTDSSMDANVFAFYTRFTDHLCWTDMNFFFMMSGFLLYRNISSVSDCFLKMKRRIKTLLIPFFIWTFITILFNKLYYKVDTITTKSDILRVFFFSPVGPLWFLIALLLLLMICPLVIYLHKKNKKGCYALLFALCLVAIIRVQIGTEWPENWWWYANMVGFIPSYILGAFLGLEYGDRIANETYNVKRARIIGAGVLFVSVLLWIFAPWKYAHYYAVIEVIGIWLLFDSSFFKKKHSFMASSFICFAIHHQILIPIVEKHLISEMGTITSVKKLIVFRIVEVFVVAVISFDVQIILKKILPPKIYALFTGGR